MTAIGLGQDGYCRIQTEAVYGTGIVTSMTAIPVLPGLEFDHTVEDIEEGNVIASRIKQDPQAGRKVNVIKIPTELHPSLFGEFIKYLVGAMTSAADGAADGSYDHYVICPVTGTGAGLSFTMQLAKGGDLADQLDGCILSTLEMEGDNKGNIKCTWGGIGQTRTADVARVSSWSYPSLIPMNFSHVTFSYGGSAINIRSFKISIDMGLDMEPYYLGSAEILQPTYKKPPEISGSFTLDANSTYFDDAVAKTERAILVTITSTENAGTAPSKYSQAIQVPVARVKTKVPHALDRADMTVNWVGYGGTTTNSGAVVTPFEVRCTDATATHA